MSVDFLKAAIKDIQKSERLLPMLPAKIKISDVLSTSMPKSISKIDSNLLFPESPSASINIFKNTRFVSKIRFPIDELFHFINFGAQIFSI